MHRKMQTGNPQSAEMHYLLWCRKFHIIVRFVFWNLKGVDIHRYMYSFWHWEPYQMWFLFFHIRKDFNVAAFRPYIKKSCATIPSTKGLPVPRRQSKENTETAKYCKVYLSQPSFTYPNPFEDALKIENFGICQSSFVFSVSFDSSRRSFAIFWRGFNFGLRLASRCSLLKAACDLRSRFGYLLSHKYRFKSQKYRFKSSWEKI